jgi:mono/diheme cytochrome c family protein
MAGVLDVRVGNVPHSVVIPALFLLGFLRARARWVLALTIVGGAAAAAVVVNLHDSRYSSTLVLAATVGLVALASVPHSNPRFAPLRRLRREPEPELGLALATVATVLLGAVVLVLAQHPERRPLLVDRLVGPVSTSTTWLVPRDPPRSTRPDARRHAGAEVAADPLGRGTWIADPELDQVALIDEGGSARFRQHCAWPAEIVADSTGRVYAACRESGVVVVIEPGLEVSEIMVGTEPLALALDEDGARLYVGLVGEHAVVALDTRSHRQTARLALPAEPRDVVVTASRVAVLAARGGSLWLTSPDLTDVRQVSFAVHGRKAWAGQALVAADNDVFLVAHSAVDTGLFRPVPSGGYGGSVAEPVEIVLAEVRLGRAVLYSKTAEWGRRLRLVGVDGAALVGKRLTLSSRGSAAAVTCDLGPYLDTTCRRSTRSRGFQGVALDRDGSPIAFAAFDRHIVRDQGTPGDWPRTVVEGGCFDAELALGRRLFHVHYRGIAAAALACATCHPEGREDGLTWRLQGARLQTPLLAGRLAGTAPYNWHGGSPTLAASIALTVGRLGGSGLEPAQVRALERYLLEGLRRPPSAPAEDAALVAAGERLFRDQAVGCSGCHRPDGAFAGGGPQDVDSVSARELKEMRAVDPHAGPEPFDTPSLRHVRLSPPYLHDGSIASLEDLVEHNHDRMGHTEHLTGKERLALLAYLRSL